MKAPASLFHCLPSVVFLDRETFQGASDSRSIEKETSQPSSPNSEENTLVLPSTSVQVFHVERGKKTLELLTFPTLTLLTPFFAVFQSSFIQQLEDIRRETAVMAGALALCLRKASGMKEFCSLLFEILVCPSEQ